MEGEACVATGGIDAIRNNAGLFLMASTLGLLVQLLTPAVIASVGSVTLKALSQVRNAGVVLAGVVIYNEHISQQQQLGYAASLVAFGFYTHLKNQTPSVRDQGGKQYVLPVAATRGRFMHHNLPTGTVNI